MLQWRGNALSLPTSLKCPRCTMFQINLFKINFQPRTTGTNRNYLISVKGIIPSLRSVDPSNFTWTRCKTGIIQTLS